MKKIKLLAAVFAGCLCVIGLAACAPKKGWVRYEASVGMGDKERKAIRLANQETPSESAPVTGSIFLIKTDVANEFILHSLDLYLFGDNYKEGSETGGLTIENNRFNHHNDGVTADFSRWQDSATGEKQNYFTLDFTMDYVDDEGEMKTAYVLDEIEDRQMKLTLDADLTFKFNYIGADNTAQQFEYTIVAKDIKKG